MGGLHTSQNNIGHSTNAAGQASYEIYVNRGARGGGGGGGGGGVVVEHLSTAIT